jgi:DNA-binding PadR family transcriptional regulator
MRHFQWRGLRARFNHPEELADRHTSGHHSHHRGHRHGRMRGGRPFDYGDLRLLCLSMIAEQPRHGYELMKGIEERMGGSYSPSPGVIYPTLSWLEDMGYVAIDAGESARKQYRITPEGEAFLAANRASLDAILARIGASAADAPDATLAPVLRAMENLKMALRLRLKRGAFDNRVIDTIAAALDAAAHTVERS